MKIKSNTLKLCLNFLGTLSALSAVGLLGASIVGGWMVCFIAAISSGVSAIVFFALATILEKLAMLTDHLEVKAQSHLSLGQE
jgi:hypothetical protein